MNTLSTVRAALPHISTGLSILAIVGAVGAWAFNSYAEDVVKSLVDARITKLESAVQDINIRDQLQTQRLGTIQDYQKDLRDSTKETQRDIKAILFELRSAR